MYALPLLQKTASVEKLFLYSWIIQNNFISQFSEDIYFSMARKKKGIQKLRNLWSFFSVSFSQQYINLKKMLDFPKSISQNMLIFQKCKRRNSISILLLRALDRTIASYSSASLHSKLIKNGGVNNLLKVVLKDSSPSFSNHLDLTSKLY